MGPKDAGSWWLLTISLNQRAGTDFEFCSKQVKMPLMPVPAGKTSNERANGKSPMQNLKIQTLWQLCQELKQKRQILIEKMSYTQTYLDQQQHLMSSELLSLRQHNNELSSDLAQLYSHLEALRHTWHQRRDQAPAQAELSPAQTHLHMLAMQFERLAGELTFGTLLAQSLGLEQARWGELGAEFDPWYRQLHDLRHSGAAESEDFLAESENFLPEFRSAIEDARNDLAANLSNASSFDQNQSENHSEQNALLQAEIETLRAQYQNLQTELVDLETHAAERQQTLLDQFQQDYSRLEQDLNQTQDFLGTKETQVGVLLQTVQVIQREFDALRKNNHVLSADLKGLEQQTDQLIGLVETYRQAALSAISEAGLQAEAESTTIAEIADEETDGPEHADSSGLSESMEGEEDNHAHKSDAVREAVRKNLNTVLRHRFGKLPRKVSSSIKEIHSSSKLSKLFDKALKAESLDEFEASLEG